MPVAITGLPGGAWVSVSIVLGSLLACVGLFALSRTTWGKSRPTHRYAAASLAVHLLLLAIASTVRYGGAQSGGVDAPPVKVRIVMRAPEVEEESTEAVATPDETPDETAEEEPEKETDQPPTPIEPIPEIEVEPVVEQPSDATEPLPELPQAEEPLVDPPIADSEPEPSVEPSPNIEPSPSSQEGAGSESTVTSSVTEVSEQVPDSNLEAVENWPPQAELPEREMPQVVDPAVQPLTSSSAWKSAYNTRGELARLRLATEEGGSQETENAVAHAVDWLARSQRPDGAWDAARWGAGREQKVLNHNRGGAGIRAETGLTGLALLAMQGAGHNHTDGPYQNSIRNGLAYLLESQKQNGNLSGEATTYAATYCHSMATFALAEALATTGDDRLRPGVAAAIDYLIRSQSKATGGWRYRPGDRGDMSQMGWVLMALRSAEIAEIVIPNEVWNGIERFLKSVERGNQGGLAAYQAVAPTSPTMTAEALYCRQILGISNVRPMATSEAVSYLSQRLPSQSATSNRPVNFYYWYYATLALHHQRQTDSQTREAWQNWNNSMIHSLLPLQVTGGQNQGSWTPTTLWGGYGGRVYSTAMAAMCLEVYYRYDEDLLGRDPWLAARIRPSEPILRR